ncbi:MAG: DUF1415 domain-containing protein [Deltaproteobacteria bacterium]|nr:MAG: DUF1415 domain-containing protein [Deltaproteobacteria bacterium]
MAGLVERDRLRPVVKSRPDRAGPGRRPGSRPDTPVAMSAADPVARVDAWLDEFIVGLDICPFARLPLQRGQVHLVATDSRDLPDILADVLVEARRLDEDGVGTTLLILPRAPADFDDFLDICYAAEDALSAAGFDRRVQVVGFHPDYVFHGAPPDDPANAVNRSPVPLLHLLRWQDVRDAIEGHRDIGEVPRRNARLLRERAGTAGACPHRSSQRGEG